MQQRQFNSRTKINEDMIGFIDMPPVRLKGNIIKNASDIVDKYVNVNTDYTRREFIL
jgi:hypothetical protein